MCGCYIIPCTWSTATFGTGRISYVNHTSGAVMVCRRVFTYAHTRVCICVGVTACVYTRAQECEESCVARYEHVHKNVKGLFRQV